MTKELAVVTLGVSGFGVLGFDDDAHSSDGGDVEDGLVGFGNQDQDQWDWFSFFIFSPLNQGWLKVEAE